MARRVDGLHDRLEVVALGFGGVGVLTWGLWIVARLEPVSVVAVTVVATVVLIADARRAPARPWPLAVGGAWPVALLGAAFVFLLAPTFLPFGFEQGGAVRTLGMTDWYKHLTVTTEIAGADHFPPVNPYLAAHPDPRYYFGFHLVAAAVTRLGGIGDAYPALLVLTGLVAAAVPLAFYGFARPLTSERGAVAAAGACLLAGFDVIVVVVDAVRRVWAMDAWPRGFDAVRAVVPSTQLDYWMPHTERQFNPFVVATAWAPQHVLAVLLALVVLSLVAPVTSDRTRSDRPCRSGLLLPVVTLASVAALSAYVAVALAVGVTGWLLVIALRQPRDFTNGPELRRWLPVGLVAGLLSVPLLPALWGGEGSATGLILAVSSSGSWSNGAVWSWMLGDHWWTRLVDTPVVYLVELGMVGLLAVATVVRGGRLDPTARQAIGVLLGIVVFVTWVRPPVGEPNNLYARPMLLVYAMLAPFAARALLPRVTTWYRCGLAVCAAGTAYAVVGLTLQGAFFYTMPASLADACTWVTRETPRTARVAVRPPDFSRYVGFACRRPLSVADRRHARLLGASDHLFDEVSSRLDDAYEARTAVDAASKFAAVAADAVLVRLPETATLPAWLDRPCFFVGHRNAEWVVAVRTPACVG